MFKKEEAKELAITKISKDQMVLGTPLIRDPELVLEEATRVAKALKKVIKNKAKPIIVNGKQYIEYADWILIGVTYGISAKVVETSVITEKNKKGKEVFIGYLAKAVAIRNDSVISGAEAECIKYEKNWIFKAMNNQRFMLRSMAQTRACSKALSNVLRWVVVLAGFEGTPAEEMVDDDKKLLPLRISKTIKNIIKRKKLEKKEFRKLLKKHFKVSDIDDLDEEEGSELITILSKI